MPAQPGHGRNLICTLLDALRLFERVQRRFHPMMIRWHTRVLREKAQELERARDGQALGSGEGGESDPVPRAADLVLEAARIFGESDDLSSGVFSAMRAMRRICRAQEVLFDLRHRISEVDDYFREFPAEQTGRTAQAETDGLIHMGPQDDRYARGSASLFVPQRMSKRRSLPLVVALHGGYGHGRDYIWTWMRQARSRGFYLLAPTSAGATWSIEDPWTDMLQILSRVEKIAEEYAADLSRMLLTGLSDGGTFALCCAMLRSSPFSAYAAISGTLPPGEISHTSGRRIHWIHGAYDWVFPVQGAREGRDRLNRAGAKVVLKIIDDLAHAHPCEENGQILTWFDPTLTRRET